MFCSTVSPRKIDGFLRQVADALARADVHRVVGDVDRRRAGRGRESGAVSPTTIENVVVLPAPFGPSRPTTSPDAISRLTPCTTVRPPYDLVRSCVRSVAIQR